MKHLSKGKWDNLEELTIGKNYIISGFNNIDFDGYAMLPEGHWKHLYLLPTGEHSGERFFYE